MCTPQYAMLFHALGLHDMVVNLVLEVCRFCFTMTEHPHSLLAMFKTAIDREHSGAIRDRKRTERFGMPTGRLWMLLQTSTYTGHKIWRSKKGMSTI